MNNNNNFGNLMTEFAKLANENQKGTAYAESLQALATAIAYSVVRKCYNVSGLPYLAELRNEITAGNAESAKARRIANTATQAIYTADGDCKKTDNMDVVLETYGDGYDLVQVAIIAILAECKAQKGRGEKIDLEQPYTVRRLGARIWIKSANSVGGWRDVETTPIQEIYRAVRREIESNGSIKADPQNGYTYLADVAVDPASGAEADIYRRLDKYADVGIDTQYGYSAQTQIVNDTSAILGKLNLTKRQAEALKLRLRGYGYKAIATYFGVHFTTVQEIFRAIQKKAVKNGLYPPGKF